MTPTWLLLDSVDRIHQIHSLKLTANAPENRPSRKETIVFQPSIFRGELLVSGRVFVEYLIGWSWETWFFGWCSGEVWHQATSTTLSLCRSFITGVLGSKSSGRVEMWAFLLADVCWLSSKHVKMEHLFLVFQKWTKMAKGYQRNIPYICYFPWVLQVFSRKKHSLKTSCEDGRTLEAYGVDRNSTIHLPEAQTPKKQITWWRCVADWKKWVEFGEIDMSCGPHWFRGVSDVGWGDSHHLVNK